MYIKKCVYSIDLFYLLFFDLYLCKSSHNFPYCLVLSIMSSSKVQYFLQYFVLLFALCLVETAPTEKRIGPNMPVPPAELFKFLRKFGYLEPAPTDSESLYTEDAIIQAIKNMQRFGGLLENGELNNETLQVCTIDFILFLNGNTLLYH